MKSEIALKFWDYIDSAQFEKLGDIMEKSAVVWCPNTKEVYRSASKYIDFNKAYPGRWNAKVEKILETKDEVITVTKVSENEIGFFCISFFKFKNQKISQITEYWGANSSPPEWRIKEGLSQIY